MQIKRRGCMKDKSEHRPAAYAILVVAMSKWLCTQATGGSLREIEELGKWQTLLAKSSATSYVAPSQLVAARHITLAMFAFVRRIFKDPKSRTDYLQSRYVHLPTGSER